MCNVTTTPFLARKCGEGDKKNGSSVGEGGGRRTNPARFSTAWMINGGKSNLFAIRKKGFSAAKGCTGVLVDLLGRP